jgi:streptogramin lyase
MKKIILPTTFRTIVFTFTFFIFQNSNAQVMVSTLAGSTSGFSDGIGSAAQFKLPNGLAVGTDGTVYVADTNNHLIRKVTPLGVSSTLAGSTSGFANGVGTAAQFNYPWGVSIATDGSILVSEKANERIRKINDANEVTTIAGSGISGFMDGIATTSQFYSANSVAVSLDGTIYVADTGNNRIRKITGALLATNHFQLENEAT